MHESARADKWLWATRFFKTRALAAEVCEEGKVKRNGHVLKPASSIQPGDVLEIPFPEGPGLRKISVKGVLEKRVGAPEAQACYEDLTDASVYEGQKQWYLDQKDAPRGRPTKRNRREIDRIHGFWD